MKQFFVNVTLATALIFSVVSCKGDKTNETEAEKAKMEAEASAQAMKFKVDTEASTIAWEGSKPTGKHNGTVKVSNGVVNVNGGSLESGTFIIDMTSITVEDLEGKSKESLEAHLKGTAEGKENDFFNVNEFPNAAFTVTGVTEKDGKTYLQGNLDMKGQKNNIEFPVMTSINGDTMTLTSEPFNIDRTKWGVNFKSKTVFDSLGDQFVSDDMTLTLNLTAKKA